jgi:large-conductance mechanosensitive channel
MSSLPQIRNSDFIIQLKKFMVDNSIVGAISGISIGLFFQNIITSLVGDIFIPAIVLLFASMNIKYFDKVFSSRKEHQFNFTNFFKQLISFLLGVFVTFLFVNAAFKYLIGDISTPQQDKSKDEKESFYSY